MTGLTATTKFAGEVSERAELLNGAMQLTLDGASTEDAPAWAIEVALSWRLGRAGAVALDEGDLVLTRDATEVVAILDAGTAELDEDTGAIDVSVAFTVDESSDGDLTAGASLRGRFAIATESWSGEVDRPSETSGG